MGIDAIMVVLVLTNLVLLGSSRLMTCIRVLAIQGIVLGILPLLADHEVTFVLALLVVATVGLKGVVFPLLMVRALQAAEVRREVEPFVGYVWSMLAGLVALMAAIWFGARLQTPSFMGSSLIFPMALFMILVGLFLTISRRKALTQVMGYVVLENGIYAFGTVMVHKVPVLVELGVLLDAFLAVFVMGIAVYHINREFDHMDADRLDSLRG